MAKQPDRWERMIIKQVNVGESYDPFFHYDDVIKILRKEHRAVVWMAKGQVPTDIINSDWWDGYKAACQDILSKLTERAK